MPDVPAPDGEATGVPSDLRALAASPHPPDRAEAGQRLARLAGSNAVDELLLDLLLDEHDTLVTYDTAEVLLARKDHAGARVVARAAAHGDPRDLSIAWLGDAVNDSWLQQGDDARTALALCSALAGDPDPSVRDGAERLRVRIESGHWPGVS